jgi:hypothetical protein
MNQEKMGVIYSMHDVDMKRVKINKNKKVPTFMTDV